MILNLTGQHLITTAGVYPATISAPTVRLLGIPPTYPTPAEILADLGIPAEGVTAITGTPIRVAPILDGIENFPDIPADAVAVIVPSRIAEAMRHLGLTVRRGVAILSPALQRWLTTDEAIRYAPDHAAAIRSLTGALTWADMLTLYDDLTGMHDAPSLHWESPEHPADTAILRLMGETGASYLRCEAYRTAGAPPRMKMAIHVDWTGRGRAVAMLWPDKWPTPIPVNRVRAALHPLGVIRLRWAAMRDPDELWCEDGNHPTRPHFHWGFPERLPPVLHTAPWYRS